MRNMYPDELIESREIAGYSIEEMARRLGVSPETIQRMELGEEVIPLHFDAAVVKIVEQALDDLGPDPPPGR